MVGMLEFSLGKSFVVVDGTVTDELDLRLTRDGLEIGVQDRLLGALSFIISVSVGLRARFR